MIAIFGLFMSGGTIIFTMKAMNSSSKYILFYSMGVFGYGWITIIRLYLTVYLGMDAFVCEYLNRIAPGFICVCLMGNITLVSYKTKILRGTNRGSNLKAFETEIYLDKIVLRSLYLVVVVGSALILSPYNYDTPTKSCISKWTGPAIIYAIFVTFATNMTYFYIIVQHLVVARHTQKNLGTDSKVNMKVDRFYNFSCFCMIISLITSPICWIYVAIYSKKPGKDNYLFATIMAMTENFVNFALMVVSVKINAIYDYMFPSKGGKKLTDQEQTAISEGEDQVSGGGMQSETETDTSITS